MTTKKPKSKARKEIEAIYEQNELAALKANQFRGRSISCGQTTGGVIEFVIRNDTMTMWYLCNPVEAVEFIESVAAACGLEILKRPKQDFTAWRSWEMDQPNAVHWKGSAPWQINDKDKKLLSKLSEQKYGILPTNADSVERPKLESSTRKRKKIEESDEE